MVTAMLPRVDLPEVLLEVATWTGFLGAFTHVSGRRHPLSTLWRHDLESLIVWLRKVRLLAL